MVALPPSGPNSFYVQVPVPKATSPARRSRLALCRLSADTLKLGLLGIPSLERMGGVGVEEFSLRLFGHQAEILLNPCSRVLHGLATVGLTPRITCQRMRAKSAVAGQVHAEVRCHFPTPGSIRGSGAGSY